MQGYRFPLDLGTANSENPNMPWVEFRAVKYDHANLIMDDKTGKQFDVTQYSPNMLLAGIQAAGDMAQRAGDRIDSTIDNIATRNDRPRIGTGYSFCLPLPQQFGNQYQPKWEMTDTKYLDVIMSGISNMINTAQGGFNGSTLAGMGTDLLQMGSNAVSVALFGQFSQIFGGKTLNPKKQAIFSGMSPRSFGFDYSFIAKSLKEAEHIEAMLADFVKCTLPSETADQLFFEFPYEWEITFHNVKGYPKIATCVCDNIGVNPANNIQLLESGHPVQMGLTLSFTESSLRTKQKPGI